MRGLYGSGVTAFPNVDILKGDWTVFGVKILKTQGVVIVASIILLIGLYIFVQRTKTGKAMRAVAEDKDVAALMGIDVDRVIVITFAVGAALAGAAGVLYALLFRQVSFIMGFIPGIKAFTAAVLGGIGSVPGAMVGGLFLGIFESVGPSLFLEGLGIPAPYQLKDVIAFTMLVLVLIFRPTGILGERLAEEKA
jgi:branched-chain amino acid transport system permease protein